MSALLSLTLIVAAPGPKDDVIVGKFWHGWGGEMVSVYDPNSVELVAMYTLVWPSHRAQTDAMNKLEKSDQVRVTGKVIGVGGSQTYFLVERIEKLELKK